MTRTPDQHRQGKANRLIGSTSPYLLQHAQNPVDWCPWGEEAIAEARRRDVPIFLSIGYSTCYWCHVMERESFEQAETAAVMNALFVCVKVDREQRPDLDDLYMTATQITTGHGGWPMSVFLEPGSLRPFYCGTYFPPRPAHGRPSFTQVLEGLSQAWREQREQVVAQAEAIAQEVKGQLATAPAPVALGSEPISKAIQGLLGMFDRVEGGFGRAPKFPQPMYIEYLLDARSVAGDEETRTAIDLAIRHTLDRMSVGGIFDQVGGGFHRYSVDAFWTVPHFEKMLYDNAMLAALYARASRAFSDDEYARVARRILEYIRREMTINRARAGESGAIGGFYSAQDAEVDGREGLNYLWSRDEIREALAGEPGLWPIVTGLFGLEGEPNFQDPHHPEAPPAFVLRLADRPDRLAGSLGLSCEELQVSMRKINERLLAVRATRKQARLDDKVLVEWNGMMIAALATAGLELGDAEYVRRARQAGAFVFSELDRPDATTGPRTLLRAWRDGRADIPAFLSDFAWLIVGLLTLHDARQKFVDAQEAMPFEPLAYASELADRAFALFAEASSGRWFDTRAGQADLFVRTTATYDGATPSGVSVMLHALFKLGTHPDGERHNARALSLLAWMSGSIAARPLALVNSTRAVLGLLASGGEWSRRLGQLGPVAIDENRAAGFAPVEVFADEERLHVGREAPARVRLRIVIATGHHIIAAVPMAEGEDDPGLMPLRVGLIPGSGSGVVVYAEYPPGEPSGPRDELRVHHGTIEFDVVLERTGAWTGRPLLGVSFQACTETECLQPITIELDVALDPEG
jgi:uncharacterized protein